MVRAGPGVFSKAGVLVREGEALGVTEENDRLLAVLSE